MNNKDQPNKYNVVSFSGGITVAALKAVKSLGVRLTYLKNKNMRNLHER